MYKTKTIALFIFLALTSIMFADSPVRSASINPGEEVRPLGQKSPPKPKTIFERERHSLLRQSQIMLHNFFLLTPGKKFVWRITILDYENDVDYFRVCWQVPTPNQKPIVSPQLVWYKIKPEDEPPDGWQVRLEVEKEIDLRKHFIGNQEIMHFFINPKVFLMKKVRDDITHYEQAQEILWVIDRPTGYAFEIVVPKPGTKYSKQQFKKVHNPICTVRVLFYPVTSVGMRNPLAEDGVAFLRKLVGLNDSYEFDIRKPRFPQILNQIPPITKFKGIIYQHLIRLQFSWKNVNRLFEIVAFEKNRTMVKWVKYVNNKPTHIWEQIE